MFKIIAAFLLLAAEGISQAPLVVKRGMLAQVAFGTEDCLRDGRDCFWDTDLVFYNAGEDFALVKLRAYASDGSVLALPILGYEATQNEFSIPPRGSLFLDIDETAKGVKQGWIDIEYDQLIRGQGIFTRRVPGRADYQTALPILTREPARCLIPFPGDTSVLPDVLIIPFDNTSGDKGSFVTSVAFANATDDARRLDLEFFDEQGSSIVAKGYPLPPRGHIAFATPEKIPETIGKRGQIRVMADQTSFAGLGLLFNATGPFTSLAASVR